MGLFVLVGCQLLVFCISKQLRLTLLVLLGGERKAVRMCSLIFFCIKFLLLFLFLVNHFMLLQCVTTSSLLVV